MQIARRHPHVNCKNCGINRSELPGGLLSAVGLCLECGIARMEANNNQISEGQGEFHEHRVRRMFMSAYAQVLQLEKAG